MQKNETKREGRVHCTWFLLASSRERVRSRGEAIYPSESSLSGRLTQKQLVEVALSPDEDAVVYVEFEEASRQKGPGRVYNVDLQRDVSLSPRQVHLVPAQIVQRQPTGAGHLALARTQINVDLQKNGKKPLELLRLERNNWEYFVRG